MVLLNAVIGFVQEGRAEQALDAIRAMITAHASVLRDGNRATVSAEDIAPGDIVLIEAGDRVPADLRLIRARNLTMEEAILTGESLPVEKSVAPVDADAMLGDRTPMAFSGTFVAAGQGLGVAVATGLQTELGRISTMLGAVETLTTPLVRQMDRFARQLTAVTLAVSALVFRVRGVRPRLRLGRCLHGDGGARGRSHSRRTAGGDDHHARHRRAADGRAQRDHPPAAGGRDPRVGVGHLLRQDRHADPQRDDGAIGRHRLGAQSMSRAAAMSQKARFTRDGRSIDPADDTVLSELARAALLCNDATLRRGETGWTVDGDPMEGAFVSFAAKAGYDVALTRKQFPRTDEIPFDARHRFMATLHHGHERGAVLYLKGAPENVIGHVRQRVWRIWAGADRRRSMARQDRGVCIARTACACASR